MRALSEKHKFYVLIIMVFIAGVIGYFRFLRPPSAVGKSIPVIESAGSQARVLPPGPRSHQGHGRGLSRQEAPPRQIARNIFEPAAPLPAEVLPPSTAMGSSAKVDMTLSGTIIGEQASIAIINNQFMRRGQFIEECEILRIASDRVYLSCGNQQRVLDVISVTPAITE